MAFKSPAFALLASLVLAPLAAQDRSRSTFVISGAVVMEDGSPCPEPVEILLICAGAVRQRAWSQPGGQFSLQLADNKSPTTGEIETAGSPSGGFGSFNRLGRGFSDDGSFGTGRTSRFGRINLSDCEITALLPGFNSDVTRMGIRGVLDSPDIGEIVLRRRIGISGTTISLKSLAAPKDAVKASQKARKELGKKRPNYEKAMRELNKAVQIYPEFASAWDLLGSCHLALDDPVSALRDFEKAATADPEFLRPYLRVAEIRLQRGEFKEAASWSGQALQRNPELAAASYLHAFANYSLGRIDEAEASIRKVQDSSQAAAYPGTHYLLGLVWTSKGQLILATQEFTKFLDLNPSFEAADQIREMLEDWQRQGLVPKAP